jgi:hypothetical protein
MACAGALEVSNLHPARITAAAQQTYFKTFLLFPYYYMYSLPKQTFKKGKSNDAGP